MALLDELKRVCDRLAPLGWGDLLKRVTNDGLDISNSDALALHVVLTTPIATIRREGGFADFAPQGRAGITAGKPSHSLLYHALASPLVHPTADGSPAGDPERYPTPHELDVVENYIYSLVANRTDLDDTFVAVFAYQYRVASRTAHRRHADLTYSRTGVARVGTSEAVYDPSRRSFWIGGGGGLPVLPARYGAFLARRGTPGPSGSVQGGHNGADDPQFIFPVHKLFAGDECLAGSDLALDFLEFHRNEKLRKAHELPQSMGGLPVPSGFDITALPYVRDSTNGGNLVGLQREGASVLVVPTHQSSLARTVTQRDRLVYFEVPRATGRNRITTSSLAIPASRGARLAPEYVNIRFQVERQGPANQQLTDLNTLPEPTFRATLRDGGYAAAHFTDDSCDGCVEAVVAGLPPQFGDALPAFSLVTAPDFLPLADQIEVDTDATIRRVRPLSEGRLPANPALPRPSDPTRYAFDDRDDTITAVVGSPAFGPTSPIIGQANRAIGTLPDCASNVFAPGWDTTRSRDHIGDFLTSSGLGSPFPEDAKLCAAIGSFWPAVAPDNGRTFGNDPNTDIPTGNQLPMLDEELGFHPAHPRVAAGDVEPYRGWDGEYGPFYEDATHSYVNYVDIARSDYVAHALAGRIRVDLTAETQSEELIARHQALEACEGILPVTGSRGACLVSFRKVDDWPAFGGGSPELRGGGYVLDFARLTGEPEPGGSIDRVRRRVESRHVCHVADNGIAIDDDGAGFVFHPL